jgi:nicotinate-nucleotide adenylyltransferase
MKIGIFGVTANPIHLGHWKAIQSSLKEADEVWVSPVFTHPFGKKFIDYDIRKLMIQEFFKEFPLKGVVLKELDKDYYQKFNDTVYSFNLLSFLKTKYPEHNFKLIIGEDNIKPEVWNKFYMHNEIINDFGVIIAKDDGCHSTQIREMLHNKKNVSALVGKNVQQIITDKNLYQNI